MLPAAASVSSAAMLILPAMVPFSVMIMVITVNIGIKFKSSGKKGVYRLVCVSRYASVKPDSGLV